MSKVQHILSMLVVLNSIEKFHLSNGELEIWFTGGNFPEGINGFIPGSFTRELLELIEEHLLFAEPGDTIAHTMVVNRTTE